MSHILIVEDEAIIRTALRKLLERHKYRISEAGSVREATTKHRLGEMDLIISDLRLPGAPGTDLLKLAGDVPVLIMTSYASLRSAVDSMRMGAADYIAKPFDHDEMITMVRRVIGKAERSRAQAPSTVDEPSRAIAGMIGDSPVMRDLYGRIHKVAPTDATILVHGETGTGKELVARALHEESRRRCKPLISVNCAAIPETLIEAELFGHEKGAFTGAQTAREGLVSAADGGTLFLDEIGELPLEAQARLLRVLQENEVRPIGAVKSRKVDLRLVAATHRNLRQLVTERKFRDDLYYRINVVQMCLAPLRERGKDVLAIAEHLLEKFCARGNRPTLKLSPEAVQAVTTYTWPGNVRELENAIQRAVILTDGNSAEIDHRTLDIDLDLVPVDEADPDRRPRGLHADPREDLSLEDYFARFVIEHQDTMSETELAKKLGVSRKCLWERRQKLGIPRKKTRRAVAEA